MQDTENTPPLLDLLVDAARRLGANVVDAPAVLTGGLLNSELLAGVDQAVAIDRATRDLPRRVVARLLDDTPVLLGELESADDKAGVRDALRRFRNQAAIARSWLGIDAQNLQLFLAGPPGSAGDDDWHYLAEDIEADDRVCRKLVWLPASTPTLEEAEKFLRRTFLARPWANGEGERAPRLDQMSSVGLPPQWADLLEDDALEPDDFVARIIEVTE